MNRAWYSRVLAVLSVITGLTGVLPYSDSYGKDLLHIEKNKERTVYTIDAETDKYRQQEEKDRENSWNMLQNITIDGRKQHEQRPHNNR